MHAVNFKNYYALLLPVLFLLLCCNKNSHLKKSQQHASFLYTKQVSYWQSNTDSVTYYAKQLDSITTDMSAVYQAMAKVGMARYQSMDKPSLGIKLYEEAIELLQNSGADSILARAYNSIGVCHIKKSDYTHALEYYFKALRIYEQNKDVESLCGVLANIGQLYQLKGDLPSAKKFILQSMETGKKWKLIIAYLDAAHTMANIYGMNNEFDSAIAIDRMGIAMADSIGSSKLKSSFFNNLGNCYMYSNRPDSARYYFSQCLKLDSANGLHEFMADNYLTMGQLSMKQEQYSQAESFFKRAIHLSDSIHHAQINVHAWNELASLYKKIGNYFAASAAQDSATSVKGRIVNEKTENRIAELREIYEVEKKEQTIALQQVKLSKQQLIIYGSGLLCAFILLLSWFIYRRYKSKKEKELQRKLMHQKEKAAIEILHAEEQERRRIAAELHDGVGQVMLAAWINLKSMETQLSAMNPDELHSFNKAVAMVGEGCKEVREVSHSMMPGALLNNGLEGALKNLVQQVDPSAIELRLHTEGMQQKMSNMHETVLYRVIQELLNNALKHSGATELDISIHQSNEAVSLLVEDNGKGFNLITTPDAKSNGLGMQNIKKRIEFLNGTCEWDSSPGNGTVVSIFIPLNYQNA